MTGIRPNAATVEPLSPSAIVPFCMAQPRCGWPARPISTSCRPAARPILWQQDAGRNSAGSAGAASAVQLGAGGSADPPERHAGGAGQRPGHRLHQRRSPDAGRCRGRPGRPIAAIIPAPTPFDGELLERRGCGSGTLSLENRAVQPAVVKTARRDGAVAVAVFLGPGGHARAGWIAGRPLPAGVRHRRAMEPGMQRCSPPACGRDGWTQDVSCRAPRPSSWRPTAASRPLRIFPTRCLSRIDRVGTAAVERHLPGPPIDQATAGAAPACARRDCHSATKSIGCSSTGGKPPSRVTSDRMLRANGNRMRGHSTSSTGSIALSGRPAA